MSEPVENHNNNNAVQDNRLADAIREIRNAVADRDDVVVDIREAQRTRLELLAEDLQPVFDEVAGDDERFDFALSAGAQPRLWIDSVAHVTLGRDRRTYRFLRDTRLGRVVIAETADMKAAADHVTRYVAERVIERRRVMEGDLALPGLQLTATRGGWAATMLRSIGIVLLGGLVGAGIVLFIARERLGDMGLGF